MAQMKKNKFLTMAVLFSSAMTALFLFRAKKKNASIYKKEPKERNPMEGKRVLFKRDASDAVNAEGIWFQLGSPCPFTVTIQTALREALILHCLSLLFYSFLPFFLSSLLLFL